MRILFDANVLLGVLLARVPHVRPAASLMAAVETGHLGGLVSATTVTVIHYLVERQRDRSTAIEAVQQLLALFEVAPVTRLVLDDALRLAFGDFEDAVQHEAARHAGASGIVTRNAGDFSRATLTIYSPIELVQAI